MNKMKEFAKQFVKVNKRKSMGFGTRMLTVLGLIYVTRFATRMIITPKSQKIITASISSDTKSAIDHMADKSDKVKSIIVHGYKNINRDIRKVTKKISKELE